MRLQNVCKLKLMALAHYVIFRQRYANMWSLQYELCSNCSEHWSRSTLACIEISFKVLSTFHLCRGNAGTWHKSQYSIIFRSLTRRHGTVLTGLSKLLSTVVGCLFRGNIKHFHPFRADVYNKSAGNRCQEIALERWIIPWCNATCYLPQSWQEKIRSESSSRLTLHNVRNPQLTSDLKITLHTRLLQNVSGMVL